MSNKSVYFLYVVSATACVHGSKNMVRRSYSLTHSVPSMKLSEMKGLASSSVSSCDHATRPAKSAPGPVHLYCP
jgi:hypothetical protein